MNLYRYPQFTDTIIDYLPIICIVPQPMDPDDEDSPRPIPAIEFILYQVYIVATFHIGTNPFNGFFGYLILQLEVLERQ
jgi:hypothetical protein